MDRPPHPKKSHPCLWIESLQSRKERPLFIDRASWVWKYREISPLVWQPHPWTCLRWLQKKTAVFIKRWTLLLRNKNKSNVSDEHLRQRIPLRLFSTYWTSQRRHIRPFKMDLQISFPSTHAWSERFLMQRRGLMLGQNRRKRHPVPLWDVLLSQNNPWQHKV